MPLHTRQCLPGICPELVPRPQEAAVLGFQKGSRSTDKGPLGHKRDLQMGPPEATRQWAGPGRGCANAAHLATRGTRWHLGYGLSDPRRRDPSCKFRECIGIEWYCPRIRPIYVKVKLTLHMIYITQKPRFKTTSSDQSRVHLSGFLCIGPRSIKASIPSQSQRDIFPVLESPVSGL